MVSVQDERGADEQGDEQDPVVRAVAREDRAQELANRRERLLRGLRRWMATWGGVRALGGRVCAGDEYGWRDDSGVKEWGFGRSTGDRLAGSVTSKRTSNSFARKAGPGAMPSRVRSRHWRRDECVENQQHAKDTRKPRFDGCRSKPVEGANNARVLRLKRPTRTSTRPHRLD